MGLPPVLGSKCSPIQHTVNILCAVLLGPEYGLGAAFTASLIRNLLGLGSLMAFPGSTFGALLCGLIYSKTKNIPATLIGEVSGTAMLGGLCAYPIAILFMGKSTAELAFYAYIIPFLISTAAGAIIVITGAVDIVANHSEAYCIHNGHPMMSSVTGTGCQLSAITAAFLSANPDNPLKAAVKNSADYLGAGAVFSTSTKTNIKNLSQKTLCEICAAVDVPVVAIGGIGKSNIAKLSSTGVDGVAWVSAIFSASDTENECRLLRRLSEEMVACNKLKYERGKYYDN